MPFQSILGLYIPKAWVQGGAGKAVPVTDHLSPQVTTKRPSAFQVQFRPDLLAVGWNQVQGPEPHQGAPLSGLCEENEPGVGEVILLLPALEHVLEAPLMAAEAAGRTDGEPALCLGFKLDLCGRNMHQRRLGTEGV